MNDIRKDMPGEERLLREAFVWLEQLAKHLDIEPTETRITIRVKNKAPLMTLNLGQTLRELEHQMKLYDERDAYAQVYGGQDDRG